MFYKKCEASVGNALVGFYLKYFKCGPECTVKAVQKTSSIKT